MKRNTHSSYKDAIECPYCGQFYRVLTEGIIRCPACGGPPHELPGEESPERSGNTLRFNTYVNPANTVMWATTEMMSTNAFMAIDSGSGSWTAGSIK